LKSHLKSEKKRDGWTHFSAFEVHEAYLEVIEELEGLFRHIYRQDSHANALNVQRNYGKLAKVLQDFRDWS
jgi:hypothetical protein